MLAPPPVNPNEEDTVKALWKLTKVILDTLDFSQVVQKICDGLLTELGYLNLGYRIIVLSLYQEKLNGLLRTSLSQTREAHAAVASSNVRFQDILIPISASENFCVKAFLESKPYTTHDWKDILSPPLNPELVRKIQSQVGIKTSMVFPVNLKGKPVGVVIFSLIKDQTQVSPSEFELIKGFTDIIAVAVQNAKLYTQLESTTKDLNSTNHRLQEMGKLKDEFVSLASHELRTPMTAIKGSISTILDGYAGEISPQAREFLTSAYNENDRLVRLVNNLLNISRIEAGKLTFSYSQIDICKLISDVSEGLQMAATEKGIYLSYNQDCPIFKVETDEDKVKEVLINLIGNAIKFTHQGGVSVASRIEADNVIVSVTDSGEGIAQEDQDLLFKKFSQVSSSNYSRPSGGTGLGLYICKQIIEGLNGKIWLSSQTGKGSTFSFSLPARKPL